MAVEQESPGETSPPGDLSSLHVRAYSAPARFGAAGLQAVAALNVLYIGAHILHDIVEGDQSAPPLVVALGLSVFSGIPWIAAAILRRLVTATLDVKPELLALNLRRARFEIPLASIKAIRPFWIPLPGPGLTFTMSSGRRFRYRLELADPGALLEAIGEALPSSRSALDHPSIAYARARHQLARRRWFYWLIKFVLFPLALTVILFRLHQYIVYGGPFGQAHLLGLASYLGSFATFFAGTAGGLVVYAGVWRFVAEIVALLGTFALPSRARAIRRTVEVICQLTYFGLVTAYVAARLLL